MDKLVERAIEFATVAHEGQERKYTGEPYVTHPMRVAELVGSVTDDPEMIAAAILHDTVEDTDATLHDIRQLFTIRVASLVDDLTDVSKPEDGNRATRKAIDREHTSQAHPDAKTIKLADLIDNTESIVEHDPKFALVYLKEKCLLMDVLREGHPYLFEKAKTILEEHFDISECEGKELPKHYE